jgi:hypothetical protein
MEQRHMQMIALAGTLGTGLFLGSGKTIAHGGPVGSLLSYILTGSVAYCMCTCKLPLPPASTEPLSGLCWGDGGVRSDLRWLHPLCRTVVQPGRGFRNGLAGHVPILPVPPFRGHRRQHSHLVLGQE